MADNNREVLARMHALEQIRDGNNGSMLDLCRERLELQDELTASSKRIAELESGARELRAFRALFEWLAEDTERREIGHNRQGMLCATVDDVDVAWGTGPEEVAEELGLLADEDCPESVR